ncbi:PAS domain-containing protein [Curvivirga sp.]|uniref:PAS domain-containing protein n=1 Tax=Curvivirga sp. TaxID=2856848 RepID=UPI003B58FBC3
MRYQGKEVFFDHESLIVSKTDLKGRITYANDVFLNIAGYTEDEVIGQPHSMIRNPNMPRVIFEFLWERIKEKHEVFAYVVNSTKNGDHYWVLAHVTPSILNKQVVGYHSTRRVPDPKIVQSIIEPLYDQLRKIEETASNRKQGIRDSMTALNEILADKGMEYNEFMAQLAKESKHV